MSTLAVVLGAAAGYLLREPIVRLVGRLGDRLLDVASDDPSAGRMGARPGPAGAARNRW